MHVLSGQFAPFICNPRFQHFISVNVVDDYFAHANILLFWLVLGRLTVCVTRKWAGVVDLA